jgi:hypothetical protein
MREIKLEKFKLKSEWHRNIWWWLIIILFVIVINSIPVNHAIISVFLLICFWWIYEKENEIKTNYQNYCNAVFYGEKIQSEFFKRIDELQSVILISDFIGSIEEWLEKEVGYGSVFMEIFYDFEKELSTRTRKEEIVSDVVCLENKLKNIRKEILEGTQDKTVENRKIEIFLSLVEELKKLTIHGYKIFYNSDFNFYINVNKIPKLLLMYMEDYLSCYCDAIFKRMLITVNSFLAHKRMGVGDIGEELEELRNDLRNIIEDEITEAKSKVEAYLKKPLKKNF